MFPTKEIIEMLRTEYPNGTRVRLIKMDDDDAHIVERATDILDNLAEIFGSDEQED